MPKGDKKKAAQQMVDMVLEGYSSICSFAGNYANMNEGQLLEMQAASQEKISQIMNSQPFWLTREQLENQRKSKNNKNKKCNSIVTKHF